MKTPPIDPASVARAMRAAAIVARTGAREEKAGRFIAPPPKKPARAAG